MNASGIEFLMGRILMIKSFDLADLQTENDWKKFLEYLVENKLTSFAEIGRVFLTELNPNQIGTQLASNKEFQQKYPKGTAWKAAKAWFYGQPLGCAKCKSLLQLEVEHVKSRSEHGIEAQDLVYMVLMCKRCNMMQRPSHKNAGKTPLNTGAALMYILLLNRPKTYNEYEKLCRDYCLTVSDIRFQEAWAMAIWLAREGKYDILDEIPSVLKGCDLPELLKSVEGNLFE